MAALLDSTMAKYGVLLDVLLRHRQALGFGLVTLLTAGGERLFSSVAFQCPCSARWNLPYALVFALLPALLLALLAWALRARAWVWLSCCCGPGSGPGGACHCRECLKLAAVPLLVFLIWVAVALLGGTFYQCAATDAGPLARRMCAGRGDNCIALLPRLPCVGKSSPGDLQDLQDLLRKLHAQSQVAGWVLITLTTFFFLAATCFTQCRSSTSFMQLKFWKIYWEQEKKIFTTVATEHASKLATQNMKCFFEEAKPEEHQPPSPEEKHHLPSPEDWRQISTLFTFSSDDPYYSSLHRFVSERKGGHKTRPMQHSEKSPDTEMEPLSTGSGNL